MDNANHRRRMLAGAILLLPAVCFAQQPNAHDHYLKEVQELIPQIQQLTMSAVKQSLDESGQGGGPALDVSDMQALLPESVGSFARTHVSGKKDGDPSLLEISSAEAFYTGGENQTLSIRLTDMGGAPGLSTVMGDTDANTEAVAGEDELMDDENGYSRVSTIDGFQAIEIYNYKGRRGTLTITAKRVLVTVAGTDVPAEIFAKSADELDLDAIARLSP